MVILVYILFALFLFELFRLVLTFKKRRGVLNLLKKKRNQIDYLSYVLDRFTGKQLVIAESFPNFLNFLREMLGFTYHSIFRLDEEKQCLLIRFTGDLPEWYMEELSSKVLIRVGDAAVGRAVATKQPVTLNKANLDPRFFSMKPLVKQTGYRSLSCYPLIGKLRIHGGFCAYSAYENIFTLGDTQFFMTLTNYLAAILEDNLLQNFENLTEK